MKITYEYIPIPHCASEQSYNTSHTQSCSYERKPRAIDNIVRNRHVEAYSNSCSPFVPCTSRATFLHKTRQGVIRYPPQSVHRRRLAGPQTPDCLGTTHRLPQTASTEGASQVPVGARLVQGEGRVPVTVASYRPSEPEGTGIRHSET